MKQKFFKFLYKNIFRTIVFKINSDDVHDVIIKFGNMLGKSQIIKNVVRRLFNYQDLSLSQNLMGIAFKNPVGLSAGFDKNADLIDITPSVGFGFEEIGTITLKSYGGNPKPWSYRLKKSKGLLVNYGLKNIGVDRIINKLKNSQKEKSFILAVSIGKTNCPETVRDKNAVEDYILCLKKIDKANLVDYYVVNISCPNAFGGEPFTSPDKLNVLLINIKQLNIKKPILLKMPINLKWSEFKSLCDIALQNKIQGVVIGNLNKDRSDPLIIDKIPDKYKGSVSGKPTEKLSNELISKTYKEYGNRLVIIGVGGIFSAEDAYEKIKRGASLVQILTGMVYEGPQLVGQINKGLVELINKDGYKSVTDVIGFYHKNNNLNSKNI